VSAGAPMPPSTDKSEDDVPSDDDQGPDAKQSELDQPLLELLGISPRFAPDELAPPVDKERLADFVRNQMPRTEWLEVWELVTSFRTWYETWRSVLRDEKMPP